MNELKLTAKHEAAHAVAYTIYGFGILGVTIVPDPKTGRLGCISPGDGWFSSPEESDQVAGAEHQLVATLAGFAAELRAGVPRAKAELHADDDIAQAREMLELMRMDPSVAEPLLRAQAFVDEHWSTIDRVANELEARGSLDGEELGYLVEGSPTSLQDYANLRALKTAP